MVSGDFFCAMHYFVEKMSKTWYIARVYFHGKMGFIRQNKVIYGSWRGNEDNRSWLR